MTYFKEIKSKMELVGKISYMEGRCWILEGMGKLNIRVNVEKGSGMYVANSVKLVLGIGGKEDKFFLERKK